MKQNVWKKCFFGAIGLCLMTQPLVGAEDMSSNKNMMMHQCPMMSHEITADDLLNQMDENDKAAYQKLSPEGKALVLKMANVTKMNNNPMMMMQKCMSMMEMMMSKMNMMDNQNMMHMQNK